eukprot:4521550-Ditylum_brightwellii.AAC.1
MQTERFLWCIGGLPERPIGNNSWVRDYVPDREKAATGSATNINPSSQEEVTHNNFFPPFIPDQDNSPPLFSEEQQTDVQASIDVPSANTRSRRPVLVVPEKVPKSDMEMAAQAYEEFSDNSFLFKRKAIEYKLTYVQILKCNFYRKNNNEQGWQ